MKVNNLVEGNQYNLTTKGGIVYKGWFLKNKACGYFTKFMHTQTEGFLYSEMIESASPVIRNNHG